MASNTRRNCTCCGKHDSEVGRISWRGNCRTCWDAILEENVVGISTRTGPAHLRRLRGIAKRLERDFLDALGNAP
jgi:hypothetical protein